MDIHTEEGELELWEKLAKINEWDERWRDTEQYARELEQARTNSAKSV
mgnify:CR=1 FL=1